MPLNDYRKQADVVLMPLARRWIDISPNKFSAMSMFCAVLAGLCFYLGGWLLVGAAVFVFLNALFDAVDGKIARLTKNTTQRGDFLDHIIDRYSDIVILLGIMYSAYGHVGLGVFAIIGTVMTSYIGTQAEASGGKRERGGLLGRADRIVIVMFLPLVQGAMLMYGTLVQGFMLMYGTLVPGFMLMYGIGQFYGLYLTGWVLLLLALTGNYTAFRRFQLTWSRIGGKKYRGEKL
ncbi:MAG: CDP-alcohol phosphatidyltransferase family protein [archaeon]